MPPDTSDASKANSKEILDSMDKPFYGDEDQNKSSMSTRSNFCFSRIVVEAMRHVAEVPCSGDGTYFALTLAFQR